MRKLFFTFLLLIGFSLQLFAEAPIPTHHWDNTEYINDNWLYLELDTKELPTTPDEEYTQISLPHTWNAVDAVSQYEYRRASSWYRKGLSINAKDLKGRIYLRFGAAAQESKVFVNGKELSHHIGGYTAFTVEVTDYVTEGNNVVDVWVNNEREKYTAPQTADFNFYGGLYRSVKLIKAPKLSIVRDYLGGPGVRVWSEDTSEQSSSLFVKARIDNGESKGETVRVTVVVKDPKGKVISKATQSGQVEAGAESDILVQLPQISNPQLWSPESPTLYNVEIEVAAGKKRVDKMEVAHGFRFYEFTADKGFFLNGKPYKLHGVSRHQDMMDKGNALDYTDHYRDIALMKEAGINWLRTGHYQQDDYLIALCDKMGILSWEEISWVNLSPKDTKFEDGLENYLKEMIEQHYNNSSIILWGLGNEVWMGDRGDGKATIYDLLTHLNDVAHATDHTRNTIFVNSDNDRPIDFLTFDVPDVYGFNLYNGWYKESYDYLTTRLNYLHEKMPNVPLILSEFGAGSDRRIHTENPTRQDFSIEYQNDFLESHFTQINEIEWLCGFNKWAFADFGSSQRGDSMPHINQKGLVTADRVRKDGFYIFKAFYSKEPTLYIESSEWTERIGEPNKKYRVFTNLDEVEFFLNGESLGVQTSGFEWDVTLVEGENSILAKGSRGKEKVEHSFDLTYSKRPNDYTVTTTAPNKNNPIENIIDADPLTFYSANTPAEIVLDIQKIRLLDGVVVNVKKNKKVSYSIEILTSSNGEEWSKQYDGPTSAILLNQEFMFDVQQEARFIKVILKGDEQGEPTTAGIAEVSPIISFEKQNKSHYELL